ncbi:MAG: type II secretion system F family protein [Candidatus Methylomirabilales bacterium]
MGTFEYSALDRSAQVVRGQHEAPSEREVVRWLREKGYYPVRVAPLASAAATPLGWQRGPTRQDVLAFTQQLHTLLEAGLEVDRSLAILAELAEAGRMRPVIRQLLGEVQAGRSLADSLAKHPRLFSRLYVNMVRAGEAGAALEVVLGRVATFMESAKAIRDEVVSAMLYPSLVLAVGGGAVVVLLNFVIPRFAGIFADSGQLLPLSTRILLGVSAVTARYWWLLLGVPVLVGFGLRGYLQTEEGRRTWDRLKLRLPLVGRIVRELEVARLARTLGTLLQSGVPVLTALGIAAETVGNAALAAGLPRLGEGVKRGEGIAGPLRATGVFPPMALHMVSVGEETGRLEGMLLKVAEVYDERVKTSVKRFLGLLEPILILSLGLLVGFIVLSMLLAIISLGDIPI